MKSLSNYSEPCPSLRGCCFPALPHAPQRRAVILAAPVLAPVAEALTPREVADVLPGGPVPTARARTVYVKSANCHPVLEQDVELAFGRHAPVLVAVRVQFS